MTRPAHNAVGLMRAIGEHAAAPNFEYAMPAGVRTEKVTWHRDPQANPQRAVLEMSDGTWLTVTVEQHEEKP